VLKTAAVRAKDSAFSTRFTVEFSAAAPTRLHLPVRALALDLFRARHGAVFLVFGGVQRFWLEEFPALIA
jgi:hypothetical protein